VKDEDMKKQIIPGCVMLVLSLVISIGSFTFLSPCVHEDGSVGACWWAGRALLGLGCLLGVLAVLTLVSGRARFGTYLSSIAVCVLGILTPGTLINLCRMSSMHCRAVMQPAMIILFSISAIAAAIGAWVSRRDK
jgi:hypothetical protein